jgi:4-diphosphocytidyl-2-C-methyl-D-erythritol kinase
VIAQECRADIARETAPEMAYAKINLALHIRRRRADGYHDLESLFAFAVDGDRLWVKPSAALTLSIAGPFGAALSCGADNLVMRAANALRASFGITAGAVLSLEKNLPVASGIGGGSADAAAALRALCALWTIDQNDPRLAAIAQSLGADVPACLASETLYGDGRGDALTPVSLPGLSGTPLLLVNPGVALSTAQVFARWDGVDRGALERERPFEGRNDLTAAAVALVPEIGALLVLLAGLPGVTLARMSGSGATCFALFESPAACGHAALSVTQAMPHAWCLATAIK